MPPVESPIDSPLGCSGVAHVASNLSFSKNPNNVIPDVIAGVTHTLQAANNEPSVKRFVFTSSSTAAVNPVPNKKFDIDESSWNQFAIDRAWAPPPYTEPDRAWCVYGASKAQGEQAVWKFVKEQKPHFECNAILPNANFGPILDKSQDASTAGWIRDVFIKGFAPQLEAIPPRKSLHDSNQTNKYTPNPPRANLVTKQNGLLMSATRPFYTLLLSSTPILKMNASLPLPNPTIGTSFSQSCARLIPTRTFRMTWQTTARI
jgi:hypothetical protein